MARSKRCAHEEWKRALDTGKEMVRTAMEDAAETNKKNTKKKKSGKRKKEFK